MLSDLEQQYFVTVRDVTDNFLFGDLLPQDGVLLLLDVAIISNVVAFMDGAGTKKWWLLDDTQQSGLALVLSAVADVFMTLRDDVDSGACYLDPLPIKTKLLLTTRLLRQSWERGAQVEMEAPYEG